MIARLLDRASRSAAFRLERLAADAERRSILRELDRLGVPHAPRIHTWTSAEELAALYRLAAQQPPNANIVELGSYLGASTCYLAAGAARNGGRVTAIDLWNNETIAGGPRDTFAEFQQNVAPLGERITILRKRTHDLVPADVRPPIDLAFIDADHSYEATRADAAFIAPLMSPHGLLAFHDAATFEGVTRAVAELLLTGQWCVAGQASSLVWLRRASWMPWPPPASPPP